MRQGYRIADRFEILHHAGSGGMGSVYRARDIQSGEDVAVKLLTLAEEASAERFAREISLLSQLSHPGIVGYVSHGVFEKKHFLVMEWVSGETLNRVLDREGLDVHESLTMTIALANALAELHRLGLVHRDVKPANLIFPKGSLGKVKLLDFGLARKSQEMSGPTRAGLMVGSPGYMSPEQARGQREVTAAADIFSLGCVLYECLTGTCAFEGSDPITIRSKVLMVEPRWANEVNAEVPPQLASLVHQMMSKNVADRPPDGAAVVRAALSIHAPRVSAKRRRNRNRLESKTAVVSESGSGYDSSGLPSQAERSRSSPGVASLFVILVGGEGFSDDAPDQMRAAVLAEGGTMEILESGQMVAVLKGKSEPEVDAARAARVALRLRKTLPQSPMTLVTDTSYTRNLGDLIERGVHAIHLESMEALFSEVLSSETPQWGIRLDPDSVRLLEPQFRVKKQRAASYLMGEGVEG